MHSFFVCAFQRFRRICNCQFVQRNEKDKKKSSPKQSELKLSCKSFSASVEMKRNFSAVEIGADHCLCVSC